MTLFFSPDEVSNWQAACKSGKVWLRLLKRWRLRNLQGFRMRSVQPGSKRGKRWWYRCGGLTAVNVGLQGGAGW